MGIDLTAIGKTYATGGPVLSDINAQIQDGELFVIVGPSGCGKSTLLRMIAGIIPITSGELRINGKVMNQLPPKDRNLSMVFQSYALYPFLSVKDNVGFGLKARKMAQPELEDRVAKALTMVNLTELANRKPRELSGGQRQRVALARAIANDAKVCLMDEPLSNLDAQLRMKMRAEIRQLQRQLNMTIIYVTHDQIEAMTMADHVMVLNDQHVQQIDTPLGIYNHPANQFVAQFFGTPQINLLPATYQAGNLTVDDHLHQFTTAELAVGQQYLLGIRPSDLSYTVGSEQQQNAEVLDVEYLGDQTIIQAQHFTGNVIRLSVPGQVNLPLHTPIIVRTNGAGFVFDQETEQLIAVERGNDHDSVSAIN